MIAALVVAAAFLALGALSAGAVMAHHVGDADREMRVIRDNSGRLHHRRGER